MIRKTFKTIFYSMNLLQHFNHFALHGYTVRVKLVAFLFATIGSKYLNFIFKQMDKIKRRRISAFFHSKVSDFNTLSLLISVSCVANKYLNRNIPVICTVLVGYSDSGTVDTHAPTVMCMIQ